MRIRARLLFVLFAFTTSLFAQNVANTVAEARKKIDARDFVTAASLLESAIKDASTIPEAERKQALSVMHFYAGLAYSGLADERKTREHLTAFLDLSPNARIGVDTKYDRRFVDIFNDIASERREGGITFDQIYPGFETFKAQAVKSGSGEAASAPDAKAVELLGTRGEKKTWEGAMPAEARAKFMETFWSKRDRNPATPENEFKTEFERRAAFADLAFPSAEGSSGAYSDRGRVFVLLGPPAVLRRRPITNRDRVFVLNEAVVNGAIETWGYQREQLPIPVPKPSVQYRFVNQKGIGEYVLLRSEEPFATQALQSAGLPKE